MDIFQATGNTAIALIASVNDVVQTTFGDLSPVVALLAGIVLAFAVSRYIIVLILSVNDTGSSTTSDIQADVLSHHMSDEEIRYKGLDPDSIEYYPKDLQ
jgi:hypothetical protein